MAKRRSKARRSKPAARRRSGSGGASIASITSDQMMAIFIVLVLFSIGLGYYLS